MLKTCTVLFCLAAAPAAAAPNASFMSNCPATIVLLSLLTQASPWCGTLKIYPTVKEAGFACVDSMTKTDMLAAVDRGKWAALNRIADKGKTEACTELEVRMWKLEQAIKYP